MYLKKIFERIGENMIKDSGNRTEFSSGAVRDIQEGKGRCDLMPLDVVADMLHSRVLRHICDFRTTSDTKHLISALANFNGESDWDKASTLLLEVSKHFEEGAKKYGEYNWQKGISIHCFMNSAIRHYLKWLRGDKDEPHDRAFVWNIMCAIWTMKHKPEWDDFTVEGKKEFETPEHVNCRCYLEYGHSKLKKPKLPKWWKHIEKSLERVTK